MDDLAQETREKIFDYTITRTIEPKEMKAEGRKMRDITLVCKSWNVYARRYVETIRSLDKPFIRLLDPRIWIHQTQRRQPTSINKIKENYRAVYGTYFHDDNW